MRYHNGDQVICILPNHHTYIYEIIDRAIIEEPPISVKEGGLIKIGYNEEIDKLKLAGSKRKKLVSRVRS